MPQAICRGEGRGEEVTTLEEAKDRISGLEVAAEQKADLVKLLEGHVVLMEDHIAARNKTIEALLALSGKWHRLVGKCIRRRAKAAPLTTDEKRIVKSIDATCAEIESMNRADRAKRRAKRKPGGLSPAPLIVFE